MHIWVKGRVQAVGFRAYVEHSARRLGLTGWTRNVGYDTVETLAEGDRKSLEALIKMIKQGPPGSHVEDARLEWESPTREFTDFMVRRSL